MVYGHGLNNMKKGWTVENEWNIRVYRTWYHMLERCYSKKYHERFSTYKNCDVNKYWLLLSNFVEDFKLIDGYDEEKFLLGKLELDKDIKSNGKNKEYSLENCILISKSKNVKQSNKTRDYSFLHERVSERNPCSIEIYQYDKQMNLIKIWNCAMDIQRELGIANSSTIACCKFWEINCDKEEWFKSHKNRPIKTAGGYIFKYYKEEE